MTYLTKDQLLDLGLALKNAELENKKLREDIEKLQDRQSEVHRKLRDAFAIVNAVIDKWSNTPSDGIDL